MESVACRCSLLKERNNSKKGPTGLEASAKSSKQSRSVAIEPTEAKQQLNTIMASRGKLATLLEPFRLTIKWRSTMQ